MPAATSASTRAWSTAAPLGAAGKAVGDARGSRDTRDTREEGSRASESTPRSLGVRLGENPV
jgi:hypothetical protein